MTIITASGKGAPLSIAEADANLSQFDMRTRLGWRDNIVQLDVQVGNVDAPTLNIFRDGIKAYDFLAGETQEAFANFHIDHDYALGTKLYPHIHWAIQGAQTGVVRWGVEYTVARGHGQEPFGPTVTVYIEQAADGTPYKHYVAEVSDADAIDGALYNVESDTLVLARFFRDGTHPNDTLDADVFVFCVDLHYQADKATTPFKRPDFLTGV